MGDERSLLADTVDADDVEIRFQGGDDQARQAGSGPDVEQTSRWHGAQPIS